MSSSLDVTDGHPIFLETLPVQLGAYFTEVSAYAAFRGTRMRGTAAEMAAFASAGYAQANDLWVNTTDGITYLYASGWKKWESDEVAFSPTFSGITLGAASRGANYRYSSGLIFIQAWIKFGAGTSIGGSGVKLQLPVNAEGSTTPPFDAGFTATVNRGGVFFGPLQAVLNSASELDILAISTSGAHAGYSVITGSIPGSWGDGALLTVSGFYKPA